VKLEDAAYRAQNVMSAVGHFSNRPVKLLVGFSAGGAVPATSGDVS
jgi:hypothetical protein